MRLYFALATLLALLSGCTVPSKQTPFIAPGVNLRADLPAWEYSHAVWAPDGRRLLYLGKRQSFGQVVLLDLAQPAEAKPVAAEPATDAIWSPDQTRIAYSAARPTKEDEPWVTTVRVKPLDGQESIDLLPGPLAGEREQPKFHRWFTDNVLVYDYHRGTGVSQLTLLDLKRQTRYTDEKLMAGSYIWDASGQRVAGQWAGGSARFWLWDRKAHRFFIAPDEPLPGAPAQWFEAWSPDGRSALITLADKRGWYGAPGTQSTLYRLDVETRQLTKLVDNAGLATWAGDLIAYVRLAERLTLVVMTQEGQVLWTRDLGDRSKIDVSRLLEYRPTFAGSFIGFRSADDGWWVSPARKDESRLLFRGAASAADWSPTGEYLAIHRPVGQETHLQVLANPLTAGAPVTLLSGVDE